MYHVIKVISLAAFLAMCSACTETETPSSEASAPTQPDVSVHIPKDETQPETGAVKPVHSDKVKVNETRSAESHTHGDASVSMVLEGSVITVELDTPLYNLLGFEHEADTATQKAIVLKAESVLSKGASLFMFNSDAGCSILHDTISVELGHHEDKDAHSDHEDDHEGDHEDDEHEDDEAHDETHKDVVLQYEYQCQTPKALKNVTVNLFEHFENLTELDLVYLGPNTQKQAELSASKSRMNLTR